MSYKTTYGKGIGRSIKVLLVAVALCAAVPLSAFDLTQKVDVAGTNITVRDLLRQIETQTGYTFAFNKSAFDVSRRINITADQVDVGDIMNAILAETGFSYIINNNHVIIMPVQEMPSGVAGVKQTAAVSPRAAAQPGRSAAASTAIPATSAKATAPKSVPRTVQVAPVPERGADQPAPLPDLPVVKAEEVYMQVVDNSVYMVIPGQQVVEMASIEPEQYAIKKPLTPDRIPNVPRSPRLAVKTNLLFDAMTTMNLGLEVRVSPKSTIELSGSYNPWSWSDNRKLKSILVQPEYRWWVCDPFAGHFIGAHAQWGHYNYGNLPFGGFKNNRYQGDLYGVGFSYGYSWYLGKRWALEATVGVGYNYLEYQKFDCIPCGTPYGWENHHYFGITKLGLNLSFLIK